MAEQPRTFVAKVQKGFRVVIPLNLREVMKIKEGDHVEVTIKKIEEPSL